MDSLPVLLYEWEKKAEPSLVIFLLSLLTTERGIKGVFKSTGEYERIEFDLQHHVPLGPMRNIYYRFGLGAFTNQEQLYFVDFANLARSNLP